MADKLTIEQFASYIKQRDPALQSVPDDVVVRNVLERRPEILQFLQTSEPREPLGSWYERTGRRIKSSFDLPAQVRSVGGQVGEEISRVKAQGLGPKSEFWSEHRLPEVWEALKKTYSDPANILGDLITAHIINAGEGGPELAKSAAKGTVATTLQRLAGAGREPVLLEAIKRDLGIAKAQESYMGKLAKAQEQEKLLASQVKHGEDLHQNLQSTYENVNKKLGARWEQLRSTPTTTGGQLSVLKDSLSNVNELKEGIEHAEAEFLQGSPQSLRQFRDLTGLMNRLQRGGTAPTWDELRTHYSAMGDAMYGRPIPANVYNALKYVRNEVVGKQLQAMAFKAGAGDAYNSLLRDHSQFENDWRNTRSVTRGGGSALAIAKSAPNAATLIPQVTGKTGDLLIKQLAKYQDSGASPMTATAIRQMGSVTSPKGLTPPPTPPEIDPVAIRRKRILQYTSRPKSFRDYMPPRVFAEPLLSNRFMREFVAKYPRREFPVPATRLPPPIGPESEAEMFRRRGPVNPPPAPSLTEQMAQQRGVVETLQAKYAQQRAAGDSQMFATGAKLKAAMDTLDEITNRATKEKFGQASYQSAPRAASAQGGGGANYTAEQLEALKKSLEERRQRGEIK